MFYKINSQAEEKLSAAKLDKEYAPISGLPEFCKLAVQLALGENSIHLKNETVRFRKDTQFLK